MIYSDEFVKKIVDSPVSGRKLEVTLQIPRKTVYRWRKRTVAGFPARFKRAAKKVWNKTVKPVLNELHACLKKGLSAMLTWIEVGKTCLRTVQRYKKNWFPPKPKPKVKIRRYERKHALSLMHTDWAVKRIKNGVRCCISFYIDDATRKLFALKAYPKMSLANTLDNLQQAVKETHGFKALLTDNGKQYHKNFDKHLGSTKHIRTRVHNPKCNGKAEAAVKKIKRYLSQFIVRDIEHANQLLKQYQHKYNNTPHSSLKYHTPNQIFSDKQKNGVISAVT